MADSKIRYVGLDVHKRVVEACILDDRGQVLHRERFALNRRTLELFATEILRPSDHVALEATTNCWAVADALRRLRCELVGRRDWSLVNEADTVRREEGVGVSRRVSPV